MKDGLYIVNYGRINGAFVVRNGEVTICAPVLRKDFEYLASIATWYPTDLHLKPVEMEPEEAIS